jgi:xylulokinase
VHEVEVFRERVGTERLAHIAGTAPATGFMGPTLLWLRAHDPARLAQIQTVVLPKDFIRLMLTGRVATEASDASSTALFDIRRRTWSEEICAALDLSTDLLPDVLEPAQVAGELTRLAADTLGLRAGLPVVAGSTRNCGCMSSVTPRLSAGTCWARCWRRGCRCAGCATCWGCGANQPRSTPWLLPP